MRDVYMYLDHIDLINFPSFLNVLSKYIILGDKLRSDEVISFFTEYEINYEERLTNFDRFPRTFDKE